MLKILIVDDHQLFAQSLSNLLATLDGVESVKTTTHAQEALEWLSKNEVDVVLSDLQMPQINGATLTFQIRKNYPNIKVLIISMVENPEQIAEVVHMGAHGFLQKNADKTELQTAIKVIERGDVYFSTKVIQILSQPASNPTTLSLALLSEREIAVLKLIAQEHTTQEIADKLFVSANTIESHRRSLTQKLGVKNAMGLVRFAIRSGLIEP